MSYAPFVLAALIVIAGFLRDARADDRLDRLLTHRAHEYAAWERERQELVSRVQAPYILPAPLARPSDPPVDPPEDDEWNRVGEIVRGND